MKNNRISIHHISVFGLVLLLSACGFTLRGSQALPEHLNQVVINAPLQYSPLSRALEKRLAVYQLTGFTNNTRSLSDANTVLLQLQPEQFERRLLSVFTSGQVAEYELVYNVNYQVKFPNKNVLSHSLTVSREYQDDPNQILAKSRELNLILDELRDEAADRIIRLLSTQYTNSIDSDNPQTSIFQTQENLSMAKAK